MMMKLTIIEADSEPVVAASVRIGDETKITDDLGVVEFNLDYGEYTVLISKEGYIPATETINFRRNHENFGHIMKEVPKKMVYCSVSDVQNASGVKPKQFGLSDDLAKFNEIIEGWIGEAEDFIDSYCKRTWKTVGVTVPPVVRNVCTRLVANMIAFYFARKDNPIKRVNDYTITILGSEIFTDDLKQDLKPFRRSSKVAVFKI